MKKSVEKGITLIALVVTIVVLLILAGISISMLTGDNGILSQAKNAREETIIADEKEGISLAYSSCKAENMMENVTASQLEERMKADGKDVTVTQDELDLKVRYPKTGHEYTVNQNGKIDDDSYENPDDIINGIIIDEDHVLIEKRSGEVAYVEANSDEISAENATIICNDGILEKSSYSFVDKSGKVYTFGDNTYGQLGDGTTEAQSIPKCISDIDGSVLNNKKIIKIYSNRWFNIVLDSEGKIYVWGYNQFGQLGDGTTEDILMPKCISDIEGNCLNGKKIIDTSGGLELDDNGKVYEISWLNEETSKVESARCINDISGSILNDKNITKINCDGGWFTAVDSEGKVYIQTDNEIICVNDIDGSILKDKKITEIISTYNPIILRDNEGNEYSIKIDQDYNMTIDTGIDIIHTGDLVTIDYNERIWMVLSLWDN